MPRAQFPSKGSRETYAELAGVLERYGITGYQVHTHGKHPYLTFKIDGYEQEIRFPFAATSSNWNAMKVSRANLVKKLKTMGLQPLQPDDERDADTQVNTQSTEPDPIDVPLEAEVSQPPPTSESSSPEISPEPEVTPELKEAPMEPVWDDETVVHFANKQLLWLPLPPHPVLVLELDREIVAERGDKLIIDLNSETVRLLSPRQVEACFRPLTSNNTTRLREAVKVIMRNGTSQAEPVSQTEPVEESSVQSTVTNHDARISKGRFKGVGLQMGRVLVAMDFLQRTNRTDKVDTGALASILSPADKPSIASQVSFATKPDKKFISVVGPIPGRRGNYYRLTEMGRKKVRELGDEPFRRAGMRPPSEIPMAAE